MAKENITRIERIEKKFRISEETLHRILPIITSFMQPDRYGTAKIRNLYCDTPDYYLIRRSVERPKFKEKLRIRGYGTLTENSDVFMEIKRKLNGIGYKRRICLPLQDALRMLDGQPVPCTDAQVYGELCEFIARYRPKPRVLLTYERTAYASESLPDFRVTVDRDLRYRTTDTDMTNDLSGDPILTDDRKVILEIKTAGAIPLPFAKALTDLQIYQAPFSKIGTCFTEHIAPNLKF